ncbi:MAG: (2Fe-2S)-binding protein [Ilumatobacteraceae bacterium]
MSDTAAARETGPNYQAGQGRGPGSEPPPTSSIGANEMYQLHVNGEVHEVRDAWVGESLLFVLREHLGLMGSKGACEQGECGSCSVLVDDQVVCSCLTLAAAAVGQQILTIEGVAPVGSPSDVQQAFVDAGAVQCGFCTPGLIIAANALLERSPRPGEMEIREELSGNVCRCTGYGRIIDAVQRVAAARGGTAHDEAATRPAGGAR